MVCTSDSTGIAMACHLVELLALKLKVLKDLVSTLEMLHSVLHKVSRVASSWWNVTEKRNLELVLITLLVVSLVILEIRPNHSSLIAKEEYYQLSYISKNQITIMFFSTKIKEKQRNHISKAFNSIVPSKEVLKPSIQRRLKIQDLVHIKKMREFYKKRHFNKMALPTRFQLKELLISQNQCRKIRNEIMPC